MTVELLIMFFLKLLDCTFGTLKNIFLFKNKHFWSALVFTISTYFYLTMLVSLSRNDSVAAKLLICLATFLGTYIPSKSMHKLDKRHDRLYIFDITSDTIENGKAWADHMRQRDLALKTDKARDQNMNKVLSIKIYCETRAQSKMVKALIPKEFNYNAYIPFEENDD